MENDRPKPDKYAPIDPRDQLPRELAERIKRYQRPDGKRGPFVVDEIDPFTGE